MFFFAFLLASVYAACAPIFSERVPLLLSAVFILFLSSIFFKGLRCYPIIVGVLLGAQYLMAYRCDYFFNHFPFLLDSFILDELSNAWNLLFIVILNSLCFDLSFRSVVLYTFRWFTDCADALFNFSFIRKTTSR